MAPRKGLYATHMRNEGPRLVEAVAEAIAIGERAGVSVQLSHHKAAGQMNWGKVKTTLGMVDAAAARGLDVHSDVYPYTAGSTVLSALFVPLWAFEGSLDKLVERIGDPATRARIVRDAEDMQLAFVDLPKWLGWVKKRWLLPIMSAVLGRTIVLSSVKRQTRYEGMTIGAIAKERGKKLHEAMLDVLVEEDLGVTAIAHVMSEKDVQAVLKHPRTMVGTDGLPTQTGKPHPRTYGTYPRVLEHYVGEVGLLTLEEAVHRMTGMVAKKLGMQDRGAPRRGRRRGRRRVRREGREGPRDVRGPAPVAGRHQARVRERRVDGEGRQAHGGARRAGAVEDVTRPRPRLRLLRPRQRATASATPR